MRAIGAWAFACCLTVYSILAPAGAAVIGEFDGGRWSGLAYADDDTGAFSHCTVRKPFEDGTILFFSMGDRGQWMMGVRNEAWRLERGRRYIAGYRVDDGPTRATTAMAEDRHQVLVPLPDIRDNFESLRSGGHLAVTLGAELLEFDLKGSYGALGALAACVNRHKRGQ